MTRIPLLAEQLRLLDGRRPGQLLPAAQSMLERARQEGDPAALLQASETIGLCLLEINDFSQSKRWLRRALELCRLCHDRLSEARVRGGLGLVHLVEEHLELALEQFQHARACLPAGWDQAPLPEILQNVALVLHRLERYDEAIETGVDLLRILRAGSAPADGEPRCLMGMARSLEMAGRLEEALRTCRETQLRLPDAGADSLLAVCLAQEARLLLGLGQEDEARVLAREARLRLTQWAPVEERVDVLLAVAASEVRQDPELAINLLEDVQDMAARRGLHTRAVEAGERLAEIAGSQGDWRMALLWSQAALRNLRLQHQAELGRSRAEGLQRVSGQAAWRARTPDAAPRMAPGDGDNTPVPLCSCCKQVRDGEHTWQSLENYLLQRHGLIFSHGLCPACADGMYDELLDAARES